jgi:hypothetical protein
MPLNQIPFDTPPHELTLPLRLQGSSRPPLRRLTVTLGCRDDPEQPQS